MDRNFELSEYQKNILDEVRDTSNNLLINAKAGSGKTSTLLLVSDYLNSTDTKSIFLAFNKHIVEELREKVNITYCSVSTLHSLGLKFIQSDFYKRYKNNYETKLNDNLSYQIIKNNFDEYCGDDFVHCEYFNSQPSDKAKRTAKTSTIRNLASALNYARVRNLDFNSDIGIRDLELNNECLKIKEYYGLHNYINLLKKCCRDKIEMYENPERDSYGKYILNMDYTDMLWFPVILNLSIPGFLRDKSYYLVDECQDLNPLQQDLLYSIYYQKDGNIRLIFVGDNRQAIYGFSGADTHSMEHLKERFTLTELPLNICYRCPENVVKLAKDNLK